MGHYKDQSKVTRHPYDVPTGTELRYFGPAVTLILTKQEDGDWVITDFVGILPSWATVVSP